MVREHVERLLNKTSVRFILGFILVLIIALTLNLLVGEYIEEERTSVSTCPPGETC